jgi:hypothetical protein
VKKTEEKFEILTETSETIFKLMWYIDSKIWERAKKIGESLPNVQSFVSAYYRRNMVYLKSAYVLASMCFSYPSMNLQRTVYETILRGYLFIVDPQEADLYHLNLRTEEEEDFLRSRKWYGHSFLTDRLFEAKMRESHRTFYKELCISVHAEIKGVLRDFPNYVDEDVEDRLRIILSLSYGNAQMMAEAFYDILDESIKKALRIVFTEIVETLKSRPTFEPNKREYSSKLELKEGNFVDIL